MLSSDGALALRISELTERFRRSLFGLPALWVIGLLILSRITLAVDERTQNDELPSILSTTVDSGRALLSAISSGTITAASVVFSLTLVSVQLASSQFSPRTLRNFLGDRFQQNVFGIVLGTFAFSIAVLRQVRDPLSEGGDAVIPQIGIAVATVLAILSLFALLGSINQTASGLRVSAVADDIVEETLTTISDRFPFDSGAVAMEAPGALPAPVDGRDDGAPLPDRSGAAVVTAQVTGWVQQVSVEALASALPEGTTIRLDIAIGSYVSEGQVLATVSPIPSIDDSLMRSLQRAYSIGDTRTLQQDVSYGILQLEDIALRALSPGINDPNTAIAVIGQIGTVLTELLGRDLEPAIADVDGRTVHRPSELTHDEYVGVALDKVRRAGRDEPAVLAAMLRMLATVRDELVRRRNAPPEALEAIAVEAALLVAEARRCSVLDADRQGVIDLAERIGFRDRTGET